MEQGITLQGSEFGLSDDSVEQMLILAERLREANGGQLDDSAILAVAEATGAPAEYVRLAVKLRTEKEKKSFLASMRSQYQTLEPSTRRYLLSGVSATSAAMLCILDERLAGMGQIAQQQSRSNYGLFTMLSTICFCFGIYNVILARDLKRAAFSGALLAGGFYLMQSVFLLLFRMPANVDSTLFPMVTALGAGGGMLCHLFARKYRKNLGLKDPATERQDLLRQLGELQDKLTNGRQVMTFLSVDIAGSTQMKVNSDPLALEYTFNEYHEFVARITRKYGGNIHSTAGDGIICAFDNPQQAFAAARNIQTGIGEWNVFRNRLGTPIAMRCGIHTGTVITASGGDVKSVNFAHVIDMAAHLQKESHVGGIAISDDAANQMVGGPRTVGQDRIMVQNTGATLWSPKKSTQSADFSSPPKLPNLPKP